MARYFRVTPKFWIDGRDEAWSDSELLLAQYLLSSPHRNLEGLYRLTVGYVHDDLGWPKTRVLKTLETLEARGFISYDIEREVVFVRKALKYQAPGSPKQIIGAVAALELVPSTALRRDFLETAREYAPDLAIALESHWGSHPNGNGDES